MQRYLSTVALASIVFIISGCSSAEPTVEKLPLDTKDTATAETTNTASAKDTLITFFDYLNKDEFEKAGTLFSTDEADWETPYIYSSDEDKKDKAKVFKRFCEATQTCLKVEVLSTTKNSEDNYTFTVQFKEKDGSIMKYGPFGGVDNDPTPPETKFKYNVKKVGDLYKVITSPLYRP